MTKIGKQIEYHQEPPVTSQEIKDFEKMLEPYIGPWRFELFMIDKGYYLNAEVKEITVNGKNYTKVQGYRLKGQKNVAPDGKEFWTACDAIQTAERLYKSFIDYKDRKGYAQKRQIEELDEPTIVLNQGSVFDEAEEIKLSDLPF